MAEATYLEAIKVGMRDEMRRDERVYIMGEDVGAFGGAFKVTAGLIDEFGPMRVIDTPLSEAAIVGAAVGSALLGQRPIAEMQFMDFIVCGFDQIVNMAAKLYYRNRMKVPIVIRGPSGGGVHGGPFHSQNPEAWFVHVPGLKVVAPSSVLDAYGLIKSAVRDDNPVLYFEHKFLYRRLKDELPDGDYTVPIGEARVVREGTDLTIYTYGWMVEQATEAADVLAGEGVSAEIVDLRTLLPLDREAILRSIEKTSKALIVHEDTKTLGVGAEVAAILAEDAFDLLDGPIVRVTAPDTPVPFSPPLERAFLPNAEKIADAARRLAAY
ncbi:MAG TPA: alpha-ketoacid dehydrogenase subunit beta [Chloroflexota bacterium]|nr:alpha-ketoacid dehydrogenase subunit beta [Chloroflexota bacterium]